MNSNMDRQARLLLNLANKLVASGQKCSFSQLYNFFKENNFRTIKGTLFSSHPRAIAKAVSSICHYLQAKGVPEYGRIALAFVGQNGRHAWDKK